MMLTLNVIVVSRLGNLRRLLVIGTMSADVSFVGFLFFVHNVFLFGSPLGSARIVTGSTTVTDQVEYR